MTEYLDDPNYFRCDVHVTFQITITAMETTPYRQSISGLVMAYKSIEDTMVEMLNTQATISWTHAMQQLFIVDCLQRALRIEYQMWHEGRLVWVGGAWQVGKVTSRQYFVIIIMQAMALLRRVRLEQDEEAQTAEEVD